MSKNTQVKTTYISILKTFTGLFLIFSPACSFGQSGLCTINIHFASKTANGRQVDLDMKDSTRSAIVKDGTVILRAEITQPITVRITFRHAQHGQPYYWFEHTYIYLQPGELKIEVPTDSIITAQVKEPKLSKDFNDKLYKPVAYDNAEIEHCGHQLASARRNSESDTTQLKTQLAIAIKKCFLIPQVYIRANPDSPLSINALQMLGIGAKEADLSLDDIEKLYYSLSDNVKNSVAGSQYAQWLKNQKNK